MEKFYSAWKKFRTTEQLKESYKNKLVQLEKDRKVLNEVSREAADKIYDWDNPGYYLDPNGTSIMENLEVHDLYAYPYSQIEVQDELDMNMHKIVGVITPSAPTDVANKQYVDAAISGSASPWNSVTGGISYPGGKVEIGSSTSSTTDLYIADKIID